MFTVQMNLDWDLLREQKKLLLTLCDKHPLLDGVVELIDELQDSAHRQGCPVLWIGDEEE